MSCSISTIPRFTAVIGTDASLSAQVVQAIGTYR